jgi:integrase
MSNTKLTKRAVDALMAREREYAVADTEVKGFHVRVGTGGEKAYGFRYKRRGQSRRMKIGDAAVMTADEARKVAMSLRVAVSRGEDPARQRRDDREAETMEDLWKLYLERHAIPKKRERSVEEDRRLWRLHLSPAFGKDAVKDVSRRAVEQNLSRMKSVPGAANRALSLLSKMMSLAVGWELVGRNPCTGVERYRGSPKERKALTSDERRRLFEAIDHEAQTGDAGGALAIELLAFTGARRGEAINATWSQFREGEDGVLIWVLQATSTKQSKLNLKPLGSDMSERLKAWKRANPAVGMDLVFPSIKHPGKPRADMKSVWNRIRARADIKHVRLHDLRHDWVSAAVAAGLPLTVAGEYAGHANTSTTQLYSHLEVSVLQVAADKREEMLREARSNVTADVVPFRGPKPADG